MILTERFHANIKTAVYCKSVSQFSEPFDEGRKTSLLILNSAVCVDELDTGIDPDFMDIQPITLFTKNFKDKKNPA